MQIQFFCAIKHGYQETQAGHCPNRICNQGQCFHHQEWLLVLRHRRWSDHSNGSHHRRFQLPVDLLRQVGLQETQECLKQQVEELETSKFPFVPESYHVGCQEAVSGR